MIAVTNVVLNRVKDNRFPRDACGVVYQPKQFSWVGVAETIDDEQSYKQARKVAQKALKGKLAQQVPQDALYYVNVQKVDLKRHKWIKGLQPVKQIGNHTFYKDKGQKA